MIHFIEEGYLEVNGEEIPHPEDYEGEMRKSVWRKHFVDENGIPRGSLSVLIFNVLFFGSICGCCTYFCAPKFTPPSEDASEPKKSKSENQQTKTEPKKEDKTEKISSKNKKEDTNVRNRKKKE